MLCVLCVLNNREIFFCSTRFVFLGVTLDLNKQSSLARCVLLVGSF
jgi:hypothetical protein